MISFGLQQVPKGKVVCIIVKHMRGNFVYDSIRNEDPVPLFKKESRYDMFWNVLIDFNYKIKLMSCRVSDKEQF
jgi:hypothetical protein